MGSNADKSLSDIKEGTFIESMIKIQELLKYSEDLYNKVYLIQKQIRSDVLNKNGLIVSGIAGIHSSLDNTSDVSNFNIKEMKNIFQRLTDYIDNVHKNLELMEEGLIFIYDVIGIRHDMEPNEARK
ncbi:hypothetical protein A2Z67_02375 [Candidatus Woesebacteria bacterium RBG_13_36_22]|uniref:Uncharacterized protein n=1 Tax=Candidatus Woesebacteria bacterium RBG_13_36_22 TaxID=1802478 RepID=A0A1F7X180_9BACT|nr:MAG: hypothetical protein A2Z67_02375 [Candidatus Woesebacteria bacterium RBG_13_36_22]